MQPGRSERPGYCKSGVPWQMRYIAAGCDERQQKKLPFNLCVDEFSFRQFHPSISPVAVIADSFALRYNELDELEFSEVNAVKKPNRLTVMLVALCAIIWSIRAILEVIYQTYNDSIFWFVLNVLCAVIWIIAFFINLKRYRSSKED